jgi:hypothetical protein
MKKNIVAVSLYFSMLFYTLAFIGFIADLFFGESLIMKTSMVFVLFHLITATGLLASAKSRTETSNYLIRSLGLAYLLISFIGFQEIVLHTNYQWSHVLYLNLMNYVHFSLGITLSIAGTILSNRQHQITL